MTNFLEITVEKAAIEWLEGLNYSYKRGAELIREEKKVVLEDELRAFLKETYSDIPDTAINEALATFITNSGMDVAYRNREFHLKLSKGIDISWKDKHGKEHAKHIYPVKYQEPEKNRFLISNQVVIQGKNRRIPDLIVYVNGLPLVVFEFKNMFDEDATPENAHNQLSHYIQDIPALFEYNAFTVVSDGAEALHGMFGASMEWFAPWKSIDGHTIVQENECQLEMLIKGLFPKERLLYYIQNFIFHEDHNGKLIKKGAKYHQFFGVCFAAEKAKQAIKPFGDGRIGVVWHTQGSGKSISMAIYTGILRQMPELKNPTIVVQVDRRDLDKQLYDNFVLAKDLVGEVQHADTTDKLRELLSNEGGGVIFTTIEKFRLKDLESGKELQHPVLSNRENIIVMADEAHRTQYGFKEGGYAQNIRKALPNASFIGFTGTPVDSKDADTQQVFGETIHTYDIKQAVEDKATVPIYYEPKLVPLSIKEEFLKELEEVEEQEEEFNAKNVVWAAVEDAAGSDDRVEKVSSLILEHFIKRTEGLEGKAMIVCMSRRNCVKMYDALTKLEGCPEIAVIMTGNISKDPQDWNPHIRTKETMEGIKARFKNPTDSLKIVIVRDMWLTGFDAPIVHTMYIDKIMKTHNLMQAIARVNRVFENKPSGLVVDFIGFADELADATNKYTASGGEGKPAFDLETAVQMCITQLAAVKKMMGGFDIEAFEKLSSGEKIKFTRRIVSDLLKDDKTTETFLKEERKLSELMAMSNSDPRIWKVEEEIAFVQAMRRAVRKVKFPVAVTKGKIEAIKDLISKSLEAKDAIDLTQMIGAERIDISVLDERFLASGKDQSDVNIKIEILRRIINDELRVRMPKNIKRYSNLREAVDNALKQYHNHALDSLKTIMMLLDIANNFKEEDARTKELGLSEEELAFYDVLNAHSKAMSEPGLIRDIVISVVKAVKKNLQLDWTKHEDSKAAIRLAVKKELRGKVDIEELNDLLKEIMDQAEGQWREWPVLK